MYFIRVTHLDLKFVFDVGHAQSEEASKVNSRS